MKHSCTSWEILLPSRQSSALTQSTKGNLGVCRGLVSLLVAFRLPDQNHRVCIDALCINQDGIPERESQVRLMGVVYSQARDVLCWLGPFKRLDNGDQSHNNQDATGGASARLAICFLRRFNSNPHEYLRDARQHLHAGDDIADRTTDETLLNSWIAIKELFDLEYFHRIWII